MAMAELLGIVNQDKEEVSVAPTPKTQPVRLVAFNGRKS